MKSRIFNAILITALSTLALAGAVFVFFSDNPRENTEYLLLSLAIAIPFCVAIAIAAARIIVKPICENKIPKAYSELDGLVRTIEEQKTTISKKDREQALWQTELSTIADNMTEGMLVINSEADILMFNKSAEEILTFEQAGPPKNISSLSLEQDLKLAFAEALSGKTSYQSVKRGDKHYSVIINPVKHGENIEGVVAVFLDTTEKEQREKLRREFTSNISHELKTPLTSISGYAEIIKDGLADGDEKRFAQKIYSEAARLIVLVGDIIKLNRIDGGEIPFDEQPCCLLDICKLVAERLEVVAQRAEVSVSVKGDAACVKGNALLLEEMIYNLTDNAIKYNKPHGKVELCVEKQNSYVTIFCRDTGIGIPEDKKDRIFERFYRVDKSRSKEIGGTGLGLSIVKHGAGLHNAAIGVKSVENEGTEISLTFEL